MALLAREGVLAQRNCVGGQRPLPVRSLDGEADAGIDAAGDQVLHRVGDVVAGPAHVRRCEVRRVRPDVWRRRSVGRVVVGAVAAGLALATAVPVVQPHLAVFEILRRLSRWRRRVLLRAVAELAVDAVEVVVRLVDLSHQSAAIGAAGGRLRPASEPRTRRMAAQAVVADAGVIGIRHVERGPEERIASRLPHHGALPAGTRLVIACAVGVVVAVAGDAGAARQDGMSQHRLRAVGGERAGLCRRRCDERKGDQEEGGGSMEWAHGGGSYAGHTRAQGT